jgi:Fe2+ or Zn2+ uptake regulation protein
MAGGRRPINLEMNGLKDNRQRIWEVLRAEKRNFTVQNVAWAVDLDLETVRYYLNALKRAGYIEAVSTKPLRGAEQFLRLVKDCGVEAPAITRKGTTRVSGLGTEAMWRTLRILGEISAEELAEQASASVPTTPKTAYAYLLWLQRAGYVAAIAQSKSGPKGRCSRYRLLPGKYTGPKPPMVQRNGQLFDANLGEIVYVHRPKPSPMESARV